MTAPTTYRPYPEASQMLQVPFRGFRGRGRGRKLCGLLLFLTLHLHAQIFPVQVAPQLLPPYSPYLTDYTAPGSQKLTIQIRANDLSISNYPCKLRITIEGVGISIRTKQNFYPQPLILAGGGIPQIIYGEDIAEYFHPNALDFAGLSRSEYAKSARLPEGVYRFTVEVLDYNRGTVVSNSGFTIAWIMLNDPPLLNVPANLAKLKVHDPINILFAWTPRHTGSPNSAFTTEYTFRLVEISPDNRNPYDAFLTQPPLFETTTNEHQLLYGITEPALLPGIKYAWQVQATDTEGKDLFKNNGHSEIFVFQFGDELEAPLNLRLRWAKPTTLAIEWNAVINSEEEIKYRLLYRPRKRSTHDKWYETRTKFTEKTLYDLQPDTEYEVKVRAETLVQESDYTQTNIFKTHGREGDVFVCSDNVTPPPQPENSHPVFPLAVNDTIRAGGYDVLVRDVIRMGGKYYGSGMAIVPWFNGAKVRVMFENINVNKRFWLTSGTIRSVWNATSTFLIEEEIPIAPGAAPEAGELDVTLVAADSLITVQQMAIATVAKDEDGNIVVSTTDGGEQTLQAGESYAIVDDVGNGYVVDKEGNIAKTTATEARAAASRGARNYDLAFQFIRGDGQFGFDEHKFNALSHYYQQLDNGDYVAWKALSATGTDVIEGRLLSGDVKVSDIRFEARTSSIIPTSSQPGHVVLRLQGKSAGLEEELVALYKPADTLSDNVLGKVNLVTYNPIRYNLAIVPVNGVALPGGLSAEAISASLNKVYNQAVVEWHVSLQEGIEVPLEESFDDGETGLLSNYTPDMRKVLKAFGRFQENTYYLFLIDEPRNSATLGYMPRNRPAGFVFVGPHEGNAEEFLKTIAHELGHGAFNLKHPFSEYALPSGTTDNVMDYSNGTALYKYQWDHIHTPQPVIGLFEEGEEGAFKNSEDRLAAEVQLLFRKEDFKQWVQKVRRVYEFLKACEDEEWTSHKGTGIMPHCFWRDVNVPPSLYYSNADLPFLAGLVDGAYLEGEGLYHLPNAVQGITKFPAKIIYAYTMAYWDCHTERLIASVDDYEFVITQLALMEKEGGLWNWVKEQWHDYKIQKEEIEAFLNDCRSADDLREIIEGLYGIASDWEEIKTLSTQVCDRLGSYWSTVSSAENDGRYQRGKLIVPTASIIFSLGLPYRVGKIKEALKFLTDATAENWNKFIGLIARSVSATTPNTSNLSIPLRAIFDDCIRAGYKAIQDGKEILFIARDNTIIAKISDDALQIKIPHGDGWAIQSESDLAKGILNKVKSTRKVYRLGTFNKSEAGEAQYWSPENPFDFSSLRDYAKKYGIPEENLIGDNVFFEIGVISNGVPYITREAPSFGSNLGGAIEVVVPHNGVKLESFNTVKLEKL